MENVIITAIDKSLKCLIITYNLHIYNNIYWQHLLHFRSFYTCLLDCEASLHFVTEPHKYNTTMIINSEVYTINI